MSSEQVSENQSRIARSFVASRRAGSALSDYPGDMPDTLANAYTVQDEAIALFGGQIAGWKVGRIQPPIGGEVRLAGPIFKDRIVTDDTPAMTVFAGGFAAAEAEFLLRIGTAPDPAKRDYTIEEAISLLDAVHVGIEIASSPFPGINDHGALVTITDFGNNNGLVIGPAVASWRDQMLNDWPVELLIGDIVAGRATAATMLDGPLGAARFLFEHLAARGIALTPGQWISSGAVTGVHRVKIGDDVLARFDNGRLETRCTIAAA